MKRKIFFLKNYLPRKGETELKATADNVDSNENLEEKGGAKLRIQFYHLFMLLRCKM